MDSNIEDLLRLMGKSERTRMDVRDELKKGGKSVLEHLVRALRSNRNSTVRRNAAIILGEIGNKRAVDALIKALNDRAISVSSNAAIALGMIGDKKAVVPLIDRLHSPSWQIRLNAAISLGWIADHGASHPLLHLLRDNHAYVRRGAAFALGQIGNPSLRDSLLDLLTDSEKPVYESAMVLASMGDLSGYMYLDTPAPQLAEARLPKNSGKKALQALKLGNLFYSSMLFPAALSEYRRALASREKNSSAAYFMILSNMGHVFRAIGQPDHAIVFYLLALRLKPRDPFLIENLQVAETLSDIQDLVVDRVRRWTENHNKFEIPREFVRYFQSISEGLAPEVVERFVPQFIFGWKSFYALENFRGEAIVSAEIPLPFEFLLEHIPVCRSVLTTEPSFNSFYHVLLKLSDGNLSPKDADSGSEAVSFFHESFLCGYLVGLLQKIWWMSHLGFSLN